MIFSLKREVSRRSIWRNTSYRFIYQDQAIQTFRSHLGSQLGWWGVFFSYMLPFYVFGSNVTVIKQIPVYTEDFKAGWQSEPDVFYNVYDVSLKNEDGTYVLGNISIPVTIEYDAVLYATTVKTFVDPYTLEPVPEESTSMRPLHGNWEIFSLYFFVNQYIMGIFEIEDKLKIHSRYETKE